ncbi:MAG: hypothetical protein WA753_01810, partial [Pseudolabrys sp.]
VTPVDQIGGRDRHAAEQQIDLDADKLYYSVAASAGISGISGLTPQKIKLDFRTYYSRYKWECPGRC